MEIGNALKHPYIKPAALYGLWLIFFTRIFFNSWVSEDAYITFRVIDNVINGYGLRWNVTERVQAYTHPLWLLLHLPFAAVWDNLFHLNMVLSTLCSSAAVGLVILTFRKHSFSHIVIAFLLPLFLSKTFMDYSGSGLETPLSFLLFACLGYVLTHWQNTRFFWYYLSLISAFLLLNRLDHLLVIAPMLLLIALKQQKPCLKQIILGFSPLAAWLCFSLFYYGFAFPNTKYAKLDTGFPLSAYLSQGWNYTFIWLTHDTSSALFTIATIILVWVRRKSIHPAIIGLGIGLALNIAYVIYIGGDYMMGRFWAFPFFVACWITLAALPKHLRSDIVFAGTILLVSSYFIPLLLNQIRTPCPTCVPVLGRVIDARPIFHRNRLFADETPIRIRYEGEYKFSRKGKEMLAMPISPFRVQRFIGMAPYIVGAQGIFIDELGLADPLLSRLTAQTEKMFYVGHYRRSIPEGYMEALRSGDLSKMDPDLAQYYAKLRLITRGDLWDTERLSTIIRFNLGEYDEYKQRYLAKH